MALVIARNVRDEYRNESHGSNKKPPTCHWDAQSKAWLLDDGFTSAQEGNPHGDAAIISGEAQKQTSCVAGQNARPSVWRSILLMSFGTEYYYIVRWSRVKRNGIIKRKGSA